MERDKGKRQSTNQYINWTADQVALDIIADAADNYNTPSRAYTPEQISAIDWRKIRDEHVPPVAEDDPALAQVYAQLIWLEAHHTPTGNDPTTGRPLAELYREFKQHLRDEIERYRWRKAGYEPTQEMLDACRSKEDE